MDYKLIGKGRTRRATDRLNNTAMEINKAIDNLIKKSFGIE